MNRRWVIAIAGLACSHATTLPIDGGAIEDTGLPPAADAAVDLAVPPDLAAPEAAVVEAPPPMLDGAPSDAAVDVAPDVILPPDTSAASLAVDTSAFFFAETAVGCQSIATAAVTVSNAGSGPSATLQVALEGAFPDQFRVDKDGCSGHALAPAQSCVVEVRFAPKRAMSDPFTADLVVKGAADERVAAAFSGAAVPHFDVFPLSTVSLDFQTVTVGSTSAVQEITWSNNSSDPATVGASTVTGDFVLASDTCGGKTIAPNASCQIGVQFEPHGAGQRSGLLTVPAQGACGNAFNGVVTLSGVGQ
jgi:hypothetical protein